MQDTMIVAAVDEPDIFILHESVTGKFVPESGIDYQLLEILSQALRFSYEIVSPQDRQWGSIEPNGSWTGMIGMLQKQEADMAMGLIIITEARQPVVDFTFPYTLDRITFAIKASELSPKTHVFVKLFQLWVWVLFFLSVLFCSGMILFIVKCSTKLNKIKCNVQQYFTAMKVLVSGEGGRQKVFTRTSTRLVLSAWHLALQVLVLSYTCVLLSFIMVPLKEPQIRTFYDLTEAVKKGKVKVTLPGGTSVMNKVMGGADETARVLGDYLRRNPDSIAPTLDSMLDWVQKSYVSVELNLVLKLSIHERGLAEDVFLSPDSMETTLIAIAFRKGFCCTDDFNKMILRINEAGIFEKIVDDHAFQLDLKAPDHVVYEAFRPLAVDDFIGLFWILFLCYVSAVVVMLLEIRKGKKKKCCIL